MTCPADRILLRSRRGRSVLVETGGYRPEIVADGDLAIELSRAALDALRAGSHPSEGDVAAWYGEAFMASLPPGGALMAEVNRSLPLVLGLSSVVSIVSRDGGEVTVGCVDGRWTVVPGTTPDAATDGMVRLLAGQPQFLRLLAGRQRVRDGLLEGSLLGDMVGLSQLTWMLEHPAWNAARPPVLATLLDEVSWAIEALGGG